MKVKKANSFQYPVTTEYDAAGNLKYKKDINEQSLTQECWYHNGTIIRRKYHDIEQNILKKTKNNKPVSKEETFDENGKLHSYDDLPAVKFARTEKWYKHGFLHRENKPAIITSKTKVWYENGEYIKEEDAKKNIITLNRDNELHSFNDEPSFISKDGKTKKWHQNNDLHRDGDKPAYITPTETKYYKNGELHREGGPAVIMEVNGLEKIEEYWKNGIKQ